VAIVERARSILKSSDAKGEKLQKGLGELLPLLRLPTLSSKDFATKVVPLDIVSSSEMLALFSYIAQKEGGLSPAVPEALKKFSTVKRKAAIAFTWDPVKKGTYTVLSNNNLTATKNTSTDWNGGVILGTEVMTGGDHYWEVTLGPGGNTMAGIAIPEVQYTQYGRYNTAETRFVYAMGGLYGSFGTASSMTNPSWQVGNVMGFSLIENKSTKTFDFFVYKNRTLIGQVASNVPNRVVAAVELYDNGASVTLNCEVEKP